MISNTIKSYKNLSKPVKATLWFTFCNILQKGILFLAVPIYTRIMTTAQYGVYSVFLSWLEIFEIFGTFRIGWGGYVVGLTKYEDDRDGYTSSMQCLSIVITFVTLLLYLLFQNTINKLTGLDTLLTIMIFGLLFTMPAIQFWSVRERVEYKYVKLFIVTVTFSLLVLVFGTISGIIFQNKTEAIIFARLIVQGIEGAMLIWANCHKKFVFFKKEYWKRAFLFNCPLIPYYLSMVVLHSSDRIIINSIVGSTCAAIYGVAYTLSSCMSIFSSAINQTIQPWLYAKMKAEDVKNVPSTISLTLVIVAVLNLILIALAPEVMTIVAPVQYQEAIWIIPPLAASIVVMFYYQPFVNVEFYFEESKLTSIASIGVAILNVVLNMIFIPIYGYLAAGYTTVFSYIVFSICHYMFMKIVCKKNCYNEKLIDMKSSTGILLLFFIVAAIMMIGYYINFIRYGFIVIILVICIMKRNQLIGFFKKMKSR